MNDSKKNYNITQLWTTREKAWLLWWDVHYYGKF